MNIVFGFRPIAVLIALATLAISGCNAPSRPLHIERGISDQTSEVPDRTSLSKPYLTYPQVGFTTEGQLEQHFDKHGGEFHAISPTQFLQFAQELRDRPHDSSLLDGKRFDGVFCRYDTRSGAFIAFNKNHVIRTFFKPRNGEAYFYHQMSRRH